ncbi:hypothetical protein DL96DRAFT_1732033 [Flagelloscypha sp. PMI_526]|nr:hypothetical protein DL96DRAFT_1732033 [Flagelloscypha sp. PMI_526]
MTSPLHLVYFNCRGRCEPIRLLLADRGTPHEFTEYTLDDWQEYVKTKEFLFEETGAILAYLDGLAEKKEVGLVESVRRVSLRDASLFFVNRTSQRTGNPVWLEDPSREGVKATCLTFLKGLERSLEVEGFTGTVDFLDSSKAAAFCAMWMIKDIFPTLFPLDEGYKKSYALWNGILARPNVKKWVESRGDIRWTLAEFGKMDYIRKMAEGG